MTSGNHSTITEFILLGLSTDPQTRVLLFSLFLGIYFLTIMGNLMMLVLIRVDSHLHSPMYFFLSHLSFIDLCLSSVTVPKMLQNLLSERKSISVEGCLAQVFLLFVTLGTEVCLLSVMAYDRYTAICHPLLYGQIMSKQLCGGLVWTSWGLGSLDALINTLFAANLDFCEVHVMSHFSCELSSLFPLACSEVTANFTVLMFSATLHALGTLILIVYSYAHIISSILSIRSTTGRSKAFSTCSSHLIVLCSFYGTALLRYLMPSSGSSLQLIFSVQYRSL
ncbi:olfactory receptor 8S1-like [Echinops telfairi]|uniref:Olfactory receptor n=1 Tax=Echinops telfairi TaxID=9371 RepID=A0ABM0IZL9_ECHTE|nr:olfactory receptor 8S1-like [Echinops telfairi]